MPDYRLITADDSDWPAQLGDLGARTPRRLFLDGTASLRLLALRSVGIVGARSASPYGMTAASTLAADLAAAGWVVISGAAYGIDSAAHRGALIGGGCTVAVVAGGLDVAIPESRTPMLARIHDQGLVVSEHPAGTAPKKFSFLERNRLIAALTRAVVVVEAGMRSGSLNTAKWAYSLRRPVLAVPGSILSPTSAGTNRLIRESRATIVTSASDVLEALEPLGSAPRPGTEPTDPTAVSLEASRVLDLLGPEPASVTLLSLQTELSERDVLDRLVELRDHALAVPTPEGWLARDG